MPAGPRTRRLAASALLLGSALLGPAGGSAIARTPRPSRPAPPVSGVFSISPGDHQVIGRPGTVLSPTLVRNTTPLRLGVTLVPDLVTQQRDGLFRLIETAASRRAAARALELSRRRFTMAPRSQISILERWRPESAARPVYAAVVYTGSPSRVSHGVRVVDRLLGVELLGLRGAGPARGRIRAVSVSDAGPHRLRVTTSLADVGATYGTPRRVEMVVRRNGGRVVARVDAPPGVILPGVTRDFPAPLPPLEPGDYTVTAATRLGGRVAPVNRRFTVVRGGLLPAPDFVPGPLEVSGTVGGPARVSVTIANDGTRAGVVHGTVSLYPMHDGVASTAPVATRPLPTGPLAPGDARAERLAVGHLRDRSYEVRLRFTGPVRAGARRLVDFDPRPETPLLAAVWHVVAADGWPVLAGLLAFGLVAGWLRRRSERPRPSAEIRLRPLP